MTEQEKSQAGTDAAVSATDADNSQTVQQEAPDGQPSNTQDNQDSEPVIVSINAQGQLFLNLGAQEDQVLSLATVQQRVGAVIRRSPGKPVLVWGDKAVPYGEVVSLMAALQEAGATGVGLVTEDPR